MTGRLGLENLLEDCREGKIDMVLTKSLSRLSRNTADVLSIIRELRTFSVAIYFETENINTMAVDDEVLLTVFGAVAQHEAETVSDNRKWTVRKQFAEGSYKHQLGYGYQYDESKNICIVEDEARIIRFIYFEFLSGKGSRIITKELNEMGIVSPEGRKWDASRVLYILRNEIYKGDLLRQKSYIENNKRKINKGELPQYLTKQSHEAIVSEEMFNRVQYLLKVLNVPVGVKKSYLFSGKIKCKECEGSFQVSLTRQREVRWTCTNHYRKKINCTNDFYINEAEIEKAFICMYNKLMYNKALIRRLIDRVEQIIKVGKDSDIYKTIDNEIYMLEKQEEDLNIASASGYLQPMYYVAEKNKIANDIKELIRQRNNVSTDNDMFKKNKESKKLLQVLNGETLMLEFNQDKFLKTIDYVEISTTRDIVFCLKNGLKLTERGER